MSTIENTKPFRGTINNWRVLDYCCSTGEQVVVGNIFGDEGKFEDRFEDGTFIRTLAIVKLDYENNKLENIKQHL